MAIDAVIAGGARETRRRRHDGPGSGSGEWWSWWVCGILTGIEKCSQERVMVYCDRLASKGRLHESRQV
jgi:hypothetical protein